MQEDTTPKRNYSRLIAIARNIAALIVTLAGAAVIAFVCWPNNVDNVEYVAIVASTTGLVASLLGAVNGSVWYVVWLLGIMSFFGIRIWPETDPEWGIGLALHGMNAVPMIPIGILVSYLKKRLKDPLPKNARG